RARPPARAGRSRRGLVRRARGKPTGVEAREVPVAGRRVRWRVAGEGPPLVLVHGLSGSWRWWSAVLDDLAERREVHLLDVSVAPRGAAEWLVRWADAVGLPRFGL